MLEFQISGRLLSLECKIISREFAASMSSLIHRGTRILAWIRYEKDLIPPLISFAPDFLSSNDVLSVALEHTVDYRTIDVTVCILPEVWRSKDYQALTRSVRPLSITDLMVLERIVTSGKISAMRIATELHIEKQQLERAILHRLEKLSLVKKNKRSYSPTSWIEFFPLELLAIEAKLSRWREALEQAEFNRSYIAVPSDLVNRCNAMKSTAEQRGIGVITVDSDYRAELVGDPKLSRTKGKSNGLQKLRILRDIVLNNDKWILDFT
jgi:hypothetical protein